MVDKSISAIHKEALVDESYKEVIFLSLLFLPYVSVGLYIHILHEEQLSEVCLQETKYTYLMSVEHNYLAKCKVIPV